MFVRANELRKRSALGSHEENGVLGENNKVNCKQKAEKQWLSYSRCDDSLKKERASLMNSESRATENIQESNVDFSI